MLISLEWLKKYVDIKENLGELEHSLTMIGQEVEAVEVQGADLANVVIGQVVEYGKHPEAEKLTLLKVDVAGEETLQIVCGAPNHKLGDKVVVALIGANLPGNFKIKKSKIRGVESYGMLCSEVELGMGENGDGIIILPEDAPLGKEYREYIGLNDVIFELEITPNRPDCLSHIGIAREVAAYYNRKVKYPKAEIVETVEPVESKMAVTIEDKERCTHYMGRYMKNIKVAESPEWLKKHIRAMGLKPINNIVDLGNFVMFEYNQPIHVFDADKIVEGEIVVRGAKEGEKLLTLDGEERELNGELVIADAKNPLAIAGIMGGKDSGVTEETTNIFIEVAAFEPKNIRRTVKSLGISSDSSYRFERGVDKGNLQTVLSRITHLIHEVAGGESLKGILSSKIAPAAKVEIPLNIGKLNKFIGKDLEFDEIGKILSNLNMEIKITDQNRILVIPPSYREDLTRTEDLYEEIIRMYGFDNIEDKMPMEDIAPGKKDAVVETVDNIKALLKDIGLQEVINYSFISRKAVEIMGIEDKCIEILNPINEDFSTMRPTLLYSLLANIRDNFNRNGDNFKFYEVSKVFFPAEELAREEYRIALALAGKPERTLWNQKPESYDFYTLKGYVEEMVKNLGINRYNLVRTADKNFHPGRAVDLVVGREVLGTFGEIHPDLAEKMDIKKERAYVAEFKLNLMEKYMKAKTKYERIVKYPEVTRDLAILLDDEVAVGDMASEIGKTSDLIEKVNIFDVYKGKNIEAGKKSVAVSIVLRKKTGTLEEKEIVETVDKVLNLVDKKFKGQIRQA
ncbi:MAG: phenylalanine--tRNA ligase subunit beta [Fusobacteriaceae bacterium]